MASKEQESEQNKHRGRELAGNLLIASFAIFIGAAALHNLGLFHPKVH
jgi:hypothetical protein